MDKLTKLFVIVCFILFITLGFVAGMTIAKNNFTHQPPTFYFDGDDEVSRVYYEGFIQFRTDDNSFQIIFETPTSLKDVTVR